MAKWNGLPKARILEQWLRRFTTVFSARVLPCDLATCLRAGILMANAEKAGVETGLEDAIVAASAERAGKLILTRNARHFLALGVPFLNPFEALPGG